MKKTSLITKISIVIVVLLATWNLYVTQQKEIAYSDIILKNVEALANNIETDGSDCGHQCSTDYDKHFCCTIVIAGTAFSLYYDYIPIG